MAFSTSSALSGAALPGLDVLNAACDGFSSDAADQRALAEEFAFDELRLPKELFAMEGGFPVYYGSNYSHAEVRGGHSTAPMMRPSHAFKLVLQSSLDSGIFWDEDLVYGYHGTPSCAVKPILESKLNPSVGGAIGPGVYFSPSPLYAQLYSSSTYHQAEPPSWTSKSGDTYYVDTMFQLRCKHTGCEYHEAIDEITATIGADFCIHNLFASATMDIEDKIIACMPADKCDDGVFLQALVIKFHKKNPYKEGGEWAKIVEIAKACVRYNL